MWGYLHCEEREAHLTEMIVFWSSVIIYLIGKSFSEFCGFWRSCLHHKEHMQPLKLFPSAPISKERHIQPCRTKPLMTFCICCLIMFHILTFLSLSILVKLVLFIFFFVSLCFLFFFLRNARVGITQAVG